MLNLYPHRATLISDLPSLSDKTLHLRNIAEIVQTIGGTANPVVWAAWGDSIVTQKYLAECLADIVQALNIHAVTWKKCGTLTKAGHPRHPSSV